MAAAGGRCSCAAGWLGGWWLETAVMGALEFVPVINYSPKVVDTKIYTSTFYDITL